MHPRSRPGDVRARVALMIMLLLASRQPAAAGAVDFEVVPFIGHFRAVERVVYSPDGRWLISSGDRHEGTSRVWRDARLRHVLQGTWRRSHPTAPPW